ncbi:MAG: thiamine biosynthesis protein ThiF, partial [Betaproteobacteria bacterium]
MMPVDAVLDLARWAPSGDNTQPWRFAVESSDTLTVFGHDTRAHCVYDLDGHPSQISVGALLETIALASTRFGLATKIRRREGSPDTRPVFDVRFQRQPGLAEDPLVAHIPTRRVHRRPLSMRRLSAREKSDLERAVGGDF